jgi:hypothetical protein
MDYNSNSTDIIELLKEVNKEYSYVMNYMKQIYETKKNSIIFEVDLTDDNFLNDLKNRLNNLVKTKTKTKNDDCKITLSNVLQLINNQNSLLNVSKLF